MNLCRTAAATTPSLLLAGVMLAQGWVEAPPVRVDFGYASSHVFRGVERAGDSAQAALELNREGFRAGARLSQPFDRDDAGEVHLNAGYGGEASGGIAWTASLAGTWFSEVPGVDHSLEAGLRVTLAPAGGFTPSLACYHDFTFRAETAEASLARSIPLTKLGAFLELNLFAGWVQGRDWRPASGARLRDHYGYWGADLTLPYRVGARSTVAIGLHYAATSGRSISNGPFGTGSSGKFRATVGVNLDF